MPGIQDFINIINRDRIVDSNDDEWDAYHTACENHVRGFAVEVPCWIYTCSGPTVVDYDTNRADFWGTSDTGRYLPNQQVLINSF